MWSLICVYDTGQSNIGEWQNHGIDHLIRQLIGQAENINILHIIRDRLQWSCNAMAMAFSLRIYHYHKLAFQHSLSVWNYEAYLRRYDIQWQEEIPSLIKHLSMIDSVFIDS